MQRMRIVRVAGGELPPGARSVDRDTLYGNPFRLGHETQNPGWAVRYFAWCVFATRMQWWSRLPRSLRHLADSAVLALDEPVRRPCLNAEDYFRRLVRRLPDLQGYDLGCSCPMEQPCHAALLLRLSAVLNPESPSK